ncbi:MAG TPA: phosphoribosyltransferase family protein [Micromonosporaceae bacterium]|nr:phosphoribosyltransferase family protein [Micromonosporaceae bacterium]
MRDELRIRLVDAFRWVDPDDDGAHLVSDASGWWRSAAILRDLGPALAALFDSAGPTVVLAPETSGFLVGPLVARELGVGFVEAYKDGRGLVADRVLARHAPTDLRGRAVTLSVRARHLSAADRVLVVDDWAETGAQLSALRNLVLDAGATYLGAAVVVDGCDGRTRQVLRLRGLISRVDLEP